MVKCMDLILQGHQKVTFFVRGNHKSATFSRFLKSFATHLKSSVELRTVEAVDYPSNPSIDYKLYKTEADLGSISIQLIAMTARHFPVAISIHFSHRTLGMVSLV